MLFDAVNFHLWKPCNYKCKFCFATFEDVPGRLTAAEAGRVVDLVAPHTDKITFVGGEPTLCPFLGELLERAHGAGLTTCVVSNGERLRPLILQLPRISTGSAYRSTRPTKGSACSSAAARVPTSRDRSSWLG